MKYANINKNRIKVTGGTMKKNKISIISMTLASILMMTACGTPLHEITEEEQQIIAQGAASIVAKYNIYQKDGMNYKVLSEDEIERILSGETEQEEDTSQQTQNGGTEAGDISSKYEVITLSESIKAGDDIRIKYNGYNINSSYQEGGYYLLDAGSGKTYVIMNFTIKNLADENTKIDAPAAGAHFSACFDGINDIDAESTFLTYSLSTYQDTLKPEASTKVVLLFKINESDVEKITNPTMKVNLDGQTFSIKI